MSNTEINSFHKLHAQPYEIEDFKTMCIFKTGKVTECTGGEELLLKILSYYLVSYRT